MLEAVFLFAVVLGGMAAFNGSPTAIALLLATAAQNALVLAHVPFSPCLWVCIDACAIAAIILWRSSLRDTFVIALFAPEWLSYFIDGQQGYAISVAASSAQFLLTVPWERVWRGLRERSAGFNPWRDFDLRVRHAP